ncbi:glycosyltransferase [Thalassolituus maritimus]|uniref:glycosyltransferase n=1 Tax=Thalassolituus maritimus TaxID=484498 RepID=UPI0026F0B9B9|nr:glycosyltransferase [Thalassolituus maritimus]|tara:strand:+ start:10289 stop:11425 length:1137 start_codon:yes stop_codon:yes gene_type:complete
MSAQKIVFLINSILYGGAERALCNILRSAEQYSDLIVEVVILDDLPFRRSLPEGVSYKVLNSRESLARSVFEWRRYASAARPDIVVSFLIRSNVCNALFSGVYSYRSVICERMHMSSHLRLNHSGLKLYVASVIPKVVYPLADTVLGVSDGVTKDLVENFGVSLRRADTVYNPYPIEDIETSALELTNEGAPSKEYIVSVGRLSKSKNVKTLLDAFLLSGESADLVVLGEGECRSELESYIDAIGLSGRVHLLGNIANPFPIVKGAKYFVSASLNEGFPNAMVEAMCLGKPIVMSNCQSGPLEILNDNQDLEPSENGCWPVKFGVLCEPGSAEALSEGMNIMQDAEQRQFYGSVARVRAGDFSLEKVNSQYWNKFLGH